MHPVGVLFSLFCSLEAVVHTLFGRCYLFPYVMANLKPPTLADDKAKFSFGFQGHA